MFLSMFARRLYKVSGKLHIYHLASVNTVDGTNGYGRQRCVVMCVVDASSHSGSPDQNSIVCFLARRIYKVSGKL